jgi:hypothetical protein
MKVSLASARGEIKGRGDDIHIEEIKRANRDNIGAELDL